MKLTYYKYGLTRGVEKIKTRTSKALSTGALGITSVVSVLALSLAPAAAAGGTTVYDNIPSPFPNNLSSEGPEAYSFAELGGQVQFAGTARTNPTVTVAMSSWACQTGHWYDGTCQTTTSSTFDWPLTLKVYAVNSDNSPGTQLATNTKTFSMPYRPSSGTCVSDQTAWMASDGQCYHGKAFTVAFDLNGVTLPSKAIISVAYNTSHYGYTPVGEAAACFTASAGCFYDSLNIGLTAPPTTGTDPLPDDAYLYSNVGGAYCTSNQTTTGTFRLDFGCWTGYQPAIRVEANAATAMPATKDQCMNNGWKSFGSTFKNQGDCVSFVATNGKNQPSGH